MNSRNVSRQELMNILKTADMPILLMTLVQLTGNKKWMAEPYLPARDLAFFADETGGFSLDIQAEICSAACDIFLAYFDQTHRITAMPSRKQYSQMMSVCVGEVVPPEYLDMMLEEMGFQDRDPAWTQKPSQKQRENFSVLIVGAGMSGLCAAIKFQKAGIPFEIVEKNTGLGGTWFENKYPGVGCDVPNHFYSYSFRPNMDWTEYFSSGREIESYFKKCAQEFGISSKIQFQTEVISAEFDRDTSLWHVDVRDFSGSINTKVVSLVVFATGQLNQPKYPVIDGTESFQGRAFHSARWPADLSLRNKDVVVIGSGASAMQLAPSVAADANQLTIIQRSPQWAIPTRDYHKTVSVEKKWLLKHAPFYAEWYRFSLIWRFSDRLLATIRKDPNWPHPDRSLNKRNDHHREILTKYIHEELGERVDLIEKSVPKYPPYGKRILVDNNWFKTLCKDNVELVTDRVTKIGKRSIFLSNGEELKADIIIFATGFNASKTLGSVDISVKGEPSLNNVWGDENPRAYLGMTTPGFPNLFFLYGPNTNLGHGGSMIFISELQVRYVVSLAMKMIERKLSSIECLHKIHDQYNEKLDHEHSELIWTHPGMNSWYKNKSGRIVSIMPWRLVDYWQFTHEPNLTDFKVKH